MKIDLSGYNAFVGGSSKGIGRAAAHLLSACGANITLVGRNEVALMDEVVNLNLASLPFQQHDYVAVDYAHPDRLRSAVQKLMKKNGKSYHILVNNSGGPAAGPAYLAAEDDYLQAFKQHLLSQQVLVSMLLDGMKKNNYGRIVNVISTSVKQPIPNLGVSNTIRGAVANWAKTLAGELAPFGITVNNVLPGATETDRLSEIISNKSQKQQLSEDEIKQGMLREIPARRFARPEEIAQAIVFLASPQAAYVNGINLPVDGGRTACL
jgi:3-oxoacyl-[acyl-carrier protein] reductase